MRGLDDGPDGLNDHAFDRMLGLPRKSRRPKADRAAQPHTVSAPIRAPRAPRALTTDQAYDLAAAILTDSYSVGRDDVEALARWVTERDAAPDDALADARRDLAAAHQRIALLEAAVNAANNAHQVTVLQLARVRAAHGRTTDLMLAELEAGIRVAELLEAEARDAQLAVAFDGAARAVTNLSAAQLSSTLDAETLAECERLAIGGAL
jgi:hypothetical protein